LAALTSSSSRPNPAAQLTAVLGALAVVAVPAAVAASRYVPTVPLLRGLYVGVPSALVLGALAVVTARRGRRELMLSLGRAGGESAIRWGRRLAFLGLYVGAMGAIALASYTVLRLYSE
jgi:hypothetical protein